MKPPSDREARLPLTRDRVIRVALALADEQGLAALSMRSLGAALGVQAMSLYNHVASKNDILDAIVDLVVSEIAAPTTADPWKVAMHQRATSAHAVLLRHPWACALLMSRVNVGPAMSRYVDATIGCLRHAGFSLERADAAWNTLDSHLYGFTLQELNFPFEAHEYSAIAASYLPRISHQTHPAMHALTTHVASGAYDGMHDFTFGLELLLDGLEALLAKETAS